MTDRPEMPQIDAIRAQAEFVRGLPGSFESVVMAVSQHTADMLTQIADALEAAPPPNHAPVNLAAIREGDVISVIVNDVLDHGNGKYDFEVGDRERQEYVPGYLVVAHYPQPRPALEWGPVMVAIDAQGDRHLAITGEPDKLGHRKMICDLGAWHVTDTGAPIDAISPRIIGPWTGEQS